MLRFVYFTLIACFLSISSFATTCSPKIDDSLCQRLSNAINPAELVSILIYLKQPAFNYPNKTEVTLDSARKYSLMVVDSLSRNLIAIRPKIDSIFQQYVLRNSNYPSQRLSPPNIQYAYCLTVTASYTTIALLPEADIISKIELFQEARPTTSIPDFVILSTQFPFDTVFTNFKPSAPDTIVIKRYGVQFYYGQLGYPTIQPFPVREDFWLSDNHSYSTIRYPKDSAGYFLTGLIHPYPSSYLSYFSISESSYKTHEYRFQLSSAILYMQVTGVSNMDSIKVRGISNTDSIRVRFDTASFLGTTKIQNTPISKKYTINNINISVDKNVFIATGLSAVKGHSIKMYDLRGRTLYSSVIPGNTDKLVFSCPKTKGVYFIHVGTDQGGVIVKKSVL